MVPLLLLLSAPLHAGTLPDPAELPKPSLALGYSAGIAGFVGDLSDDRAVLVQEVELDTLFLRNSTGRLSGHLGIDTLWTHTQQDGDQFPYPAGAELRVLSFLFVANLCWQPVRGLSGCVGLGEGTVNVNAPLHRRDYGTWNYAAELDWRVASGLSLVARGRFIGRVEQQVDGVDAAFSLYSATGGLSWTF